MNKRKGRYYLGRVVKSGYLDQEKLLAAIGDPVVIERGQYRWTIVGIEEGDVNGSPFVFGNLAKYQDTGAVQVVKESERRQRELSVQGLLVAKSPFVYFRAFSGIAYLHVWNAIEELAFRRRFSKIVREKYNDFFVDCAIEAISDIRSFVSKVTSLETILEIKAQVHPPNPLFGICWKHLNDYIAQRRADTVSVREESSSEKGGLRSEIQELIRRILAKQPKLEIQPSLTDAALLMATDGYGKGQIIGVDETKTQVVIRTSDTQKSFLFSKEPEVQPFAERAYEMFQGISEERKMMHANH